MHCTRRSECKGKGHSMRVRNARQEVQPLLAIRPQPSVNDNVDRQNIIIVVESEDENDEFSDQEDDEEDAMR